jgi:hypothetical protein
MYPITVIHPNQGQRSNIPLSGNFVVRCGSAINAKVSAPISYDSNAATIKNKIMSGCTDFLNKIEVFDSSKYAYYANGREFFIKFSDVSGSVDQFSI